MENRVMVPAAAVGEGWSNPAGALDEGGGVAVYPAHRVSSDWLKLTDLSDRVLPSDRDLLGIEVYVVAETPVFAPNAMGHRNGGTNWPDMDTPAAEVLDGNAGTEFDPQAPAYVTSDAATVILDFGSPVEGESIYAVFGDPNTFVQPTWSVSDNGTTWTDFSDDVSPIAHGLLTVTQAIPATTARYWRMHLSVAPYPLFSGVPIRSRIFEFRVLGADGQPPVPPSELAQRLEVALTLDGSTPVGAPQSLSVSEGGELVFGDPASTFGATLTVSHLTSATFGFLIRRSTLEDENTSTDRRVVFAYLVAYFSDALTEPSEGDRGNVRSERRASRTTLRAPEVTEPRITQPRSVEPTPQTKVVPPPTSPPVFPETSRTSPSRSPERRAPTPARTNPGVVREINQHFYIQVSSVGAFKRMQSQIYQFGARAIDQALRGGE